MVLDQDRGRAAGRLAGAPGAAAGLAEDALGLELGVRALAGRAEFRVRLAAPFWDSGLFFPLYGIFAIRRSLVVLVGQRDRAHGLQFGQDASVPLGLLVVYRSGQCRGHPQDVDVRAGDDLQVHAVLLVFSGVEGSGRGGWGSGARPWACWGMAQPQHV